MFLLIAQARSEGIAVPLFRALNLTRDEPYMESSISDRGPPDRIPCWPTSRELWGRLGEAVMTGFWSLDPVILAV